MDVLIVYANSGRGLQKDASILEAALHQLGYQARQVQRPPTPAWRSRLSAYRFKALERFCPGFLRKLFYRSQVASLKLLKPAQQADLVIHLENVWVSQLTAGRHHWLIPNQEWFVESRLPYLSFINRILCKTNHAVAIFSALHSNTHYLGFTGGEIGAQTGSEKKDYRLALHVAGNSQFKGTQSVLSCWQRHPEWPKLILVSQHLEPTSCSASNIEIKPTLTSNELIALWAQAGFAILPSEVEGYSQTLAESMANGCITITTNAAPMNELVEEDRGFLAEVEGKLTFRLGTRYFVSEQALERSIQTAIDQQPDTLENMSRLAIEWYLTNHKQFLSRLEHQLNGLAAPPLDQSAQESPGR
ncbi:glycosyltransferase [Marinobacter nauticus]|uniref:Glycosyl transferase family 1 n=1 Tax=Marinobacter nauticus TaxID=2743 RepID=A0A368UY04_MARNT|nr:glycosyltransferase [Marinobacter nauticus]RBP71947.1 glycosyl transferase family 1 [Marinobacter nauticus]RCW32965.1 glycosyl transferase family 1 [Marinobacter nauticus]